MFVKTTTNLTLAGVPGLPRLPFGLIGILSLSDTSLYDGQLAVEITSAGPFNASQGTGKVIVCPTNDVLDVNAVEQTVTAWFNTSITFTAVRSTIDYNTNVYLFVVNSDGHSTDSGTLITFYDPSDIQISVFVRRLTFVTNTVIQY